MPVVKLQVPGDIAYRDLTTRMISFVCKLASQAVINNDRNPPREFTDQLVSAVGEAFNNVVLHGYRGRPIGNVLVTMTFDSKMIRVDLIDEGNTFNPATIAVPDFSSLPESGMGLFIIRSFVDELEYKPGPPNVLSMTKFLSRPKRR